MRNKVYNDLKKEIIKDFRNKNNTYQYSDRLQVSLHEVLDAWVSSLTYEEVMDYLKDFDNLDFETLDSGLYEGVLRKRGLETFHRVLLYCLIEQDLYNEEDFNKLQDVKKVAGIKLI